MLNHIYDLFVYAHNIEDADKRTEYINKIGDVEYIIKHNK